MGSEKLHVPYQTRRPRCQIRDSIRIMEKKMESIGINYRDSMGFILGILLGLYWAQ